MNLLERLRKSLGLGVEREDEREIEIPDLPARVYFFGREGDHHYFSSIDISESERLVGLSVIRRSKEDYKGDTEWERKFYVRQAEVDSIPLKEESKRIVLVNGQRLDESSREVRIIKCDEIDDSLMRAFSQTLARELGKQVETEEESTEE